MKPFRRKLSSTSLPWLILHTARCAMERPTKGSFSAGQAGLENQTLQRASYTCCAPSGRMVGTRPLYQRSASTLPALLSALLDAFCSAPTRQTPVLSAARRCRMLRHSCAYSIIQLPCLLPPPPSQHQHREMAGCSSAACSVLVCKGLCAFVAEACICLILMKDLTRCVK